MQITSTEDDAWCSNNQSLKYVFSYIKYKFDNLFTHGLSFIIPLIAILTVFIVFTFSVIYYVTKAADNYQDALWETFTRILDPCSAAHDEGVKHRILSGIVILCGLVIIAVLIGAIVTFMEQNLYEIKKGHTTVIEKNHTSKMKD